MSNKKAVWQQAKQLWLNSIFSFFGKDGADDTQKKKLGFNVPRWWTKFPNEAKKGFRIFSSDSEMPMNDAVDSTVDDVSELQGDTVMMKSRIYNQLTLEFSVVVGLGKDKVKYVKLISLPPGTQSYWVYSDLHQGLIQVLQYQKSFLSKLGFDDDKFILKMPRTRRHTKCPRHSAKGSQLFELRQLKLKEESTEVSNGRMPPCDKLDFHGAQSEINNVNSDGWMFVGDNNFPEETHDKLKGEAETRHLVARRKADSVSSSYKRWSSNVIPANANRAKLVDPLRMPPGITAPTIGTIKLYPAYSEFTPILVLIFVVWWFLKLFKNENVFSFLTKKKKPKKYPDNSTIV
eukprot:GHVQ01036199.1.p1 GENE.GHVQ01036199.1~~GHVQ01036199.1.p1  ORF type:complete len:347 (-),score=39.20 GHVQ01036199.1:1362-2402(-)